MNLWGGRFKAAGQDVLWRYSVSTADHRLLSADLKGSLAHVRMLAQSGVLRQHDADELLRGLLMIQQECETGTFRFLTTDEDVHSAVERRLMEQVGEVAGMLHTARSRNDQVATDLRLYLAEATGLRIQQLTQWIATVVDKAQQVQEQVVNSYTHLQPAQAIPLAHHLLAYAWMAKRDVERFVDALKRIDQCPLGAGASAGSSFPVDPSLTASLLGANSHFDNSMDAVASRDFASEYAFCCAQSMVHLSRLCEELILWSGVEFGWVTLADDLTTGSSALPQKKNPDIAELARGRTAGAISELNALLVLQKALPLAYNRDLQEDKEHLFRVDDVLSGSLEAMTALVASAHFHPPAASPAVVALDLAELLCEKGLPFRKSHEAVGRLVLLAETNGRDLNQLTAAEVEDVLGSNLRVTDEELARLTAERSVELRRSPGGGSFASVEQQLEALSSWLAANPAHAPTDSPPVS